MVFKMAVEFDNMSVANSLVDINFHTHLAKKEKQKTKNLISLLLQFIEITF